MKKTTMTMLGEFFGAFQGNRILIIYAVSTLYLLLAEKELRKKLVLPSLLLLILIVNPIMYKYVWTTLLQYAYWRTIWMLPVLPVIAACVVCVAARIGRKIPSLIIVLLAAGLIAGTGTLVYKGTFAPAENAFKLPRRAVEVCEVILEDSEEPWCVMDPIMVCYVRQYSSQIHLIFGRDIWGFIDRCPPEGKAMYAEMTKEKPDIHWIAEQMQEYGYQYLVIFHAKLDSEEIMQQEGFTYMAEKEGYRIYRLDH